MYSGWRPRCVWGLPAPRACSDLDPLLEINDYLPYGTRVDSGASSLTDQENTYRFAGKEEQRIESFDSGLLDFGARFYDPYTCRWSTSDPLAQKYPDFSPYAYCAGDPVNFVDPDGREKIYNISYEINHISLLLSAIQFPDDKAIHVFSHGNPKGLSYNSKTIPYKSIDSFLQSRSKEWGEKDSDSRVVVLHSCSSGSYAKSLSELDTFNDVIVVAVEGFLHVEQPSYETVVLLDKNIPSSERNGGLWVIYMNGVLIGTLNWNEQPTYTNIMEILQTANDKDKKYEKNN